jgi:hypothetical protein
LSDQGWQQPATLHMIFLEAIVIISKRGAALLLALIEQRS